MINSGAGPVAVVVTDMLETVLYASLAGIGIAVVFSLALLGATKSIDYSRNERRPAAIVAGFLSGLALAICLAGVGFGLFVMATD